MAYKKKCEQKKRIGNLTNKNKKLRKNHRISVLTARSCGSIFNILPPVNSVHGAA